MIPEETTDTIKKITKEFFEKTTFDVEINFLTPKDQTFFIEVKTDEPQILIGEKGQTLADIQRLLKIILRRKMEDVFYIDVDVNNYKKKKIEYLKELANSVADEVSLGKREKTLSPMQAYERRIIHMELSERDDVITESVDKEPERKVVVKPAS
jgi:spoIIIJ-associated protein